jgi:selenocysteine lyase/cysteine desulfurase
MRKAVNEQLPCQGHFFNVDHPTDRFTPAGPDHAQIVSVNGVIDYFEAVYSHHFGKGEVAAKKKTSAVRALFQHAERRKLQPLLDFISHRKGVRLIGKAVTKNRAPTVSLTVEGRDPAEIAAELASQKIGVGNGNCYAYRLMGALGIPPDEGVLRLSFVHYTRQEEINRLMEALDRIL